MLGAVLALLALAACTSVGGGEEIRVVSGERAGEMFSNRRCQGGAGQEVTFVVKNEGNQDHEFESDEAGSKRLLYREAASGG